MFHRPPPETRVYAPFKADDKARRVRFQIRLADGEVMRVTFTDCRVIRTSPDERELVLFCPLFNAILSGRDLRPLADAIDAHACVWVQEFDPARWDAPGPFTPLLRRVEFFTPHMPEMKRPAPALVK
jgi:hypothetical protein